MKFTIEHSVLSNALAHVQTIVEKRTTNPLLSNVKITANENGLTLDATDNDMELSEQIPATVAEEGVITIPAHKLYDIVRKLPQGSEVQCELNPENQKMNIKAGRSRFILGTMPGDEFPSISDGEMTHSFVINAATLLELLNRTSFAVSMEETRYYLNGIYLHCLTKTSDSGEEVQLLRAVATDGHRLACSETSMPAGGVGMPGVIVPRKAIGELTKLLTGSEEDIEISLSTYKVRFKFKKLVLTSLLIDGTFPEYERVIPMGNDKKANINAQTLSAIVDRVSCMSEKSHSIRLSFAKDLLTLSASNMEDGGSAQDEMEIVYDGEPVDIGFNFTYLDAILKQIKSSELVIEFADSTSPALLKDVKDDNSLFVLMPLRV
ncbi:MAG: DNA polymerase III subunit beta [Alphaproteobacteria bacterium]|nr:DNA polymerase III subunit beta [Alphaproteobacteria bacterium]